MANIWRLWVLEIGMDWRFQSLEQILTMCPMLLGTDNRHD
jgi:hypothetical protein